MKNFLKLVITIIMISIIASCSKDSLNIENKNNPTFAVLETEDGLVQLASGVYDSAITLGVPIDNWYDFYWMTQGYHESMADAIYIPWGNWGWRWANQPTSITLDDGTVVTPPQEGAQGKALEDRNVRTQGEGNAFAHEWMTMYKTNNTANLILDLIESTNFSGDAGMKKATLKAWSYFWKGYAYSRIGSMYTAGLIIDTPNSTNSNFVDRNAIIDEATRNFDLAVSELNSISTDISSFMGTIIPSHLAASPFRGSSPSSILNKEMFIRNINTLKARNILANKKTNDLNPSDWGNIMSFVDNGIRANDFIFVMKQDGNNFIISVVLPHRLLIGWHFLSERLVQDFKANDQRFTDNVITLGSPQINRSGRGIQYGTRWGLVDGDYATRMDGKANIYMGATYDENELMKAEVYINTGRIEDGLAIIDNIRTFQQANLPNVAGNSLTLNQAREELRRERRIGLFLRGVGFYDARRWGVIDPVSAGGGRTGVTVLDASGNLNTNATFDYNYLNYWSVPDQELVFNTPGESSVEVTAKQ